MLSRDGTDLTTPPPASGTPAEVTQSPGRTPADWMAAAVAQGLDPRPTPVTWRTMPSLLERTWRTERINHGTLGRRRDFRPRRVLASMLPSVDRPVFLIGAARSGTTFLGDAIGRLPEVSYHHEPVATKAAGRYVADGSWSERRARRFYRTIYAWLIRYQVDGGLRFAEKTPTNAFLLPFLDRSFRDARFVHIIRDGRDVASSHLQRPWLRADAATSGKREPGGYPYGPWAPWWVPASDREAFESGPDILRMSMAWRLYVAAARTDGAALGADRYLEIRYESLVRAPQAVGAQLLDFLGIDAHASRAAFETALSAASVGSVGTWKRTLEPAQLAVLDADSGALLRDLGYLEGG